MAQLVTAAHPFTSRQSCYEFWADDLTFAIEIWFKVTAHNLSTRTVYAENGPDINLCSTNSSSKARPELFAMSTSLYTYERQKAVSLFKLFIRKLYIKWQFIHIKYLNSYISSINLHFLINHLQNRERTWNIYTLKMLYKTIVICNGYKLCFFLNWACLRLCSPSLEHHTL